MQELATLVRRYMEREGVSQEVLAERIGVDQSTISRACARPAQRRSKARDKLMSFLSAALDTSQSHESALKLHGDIVEAVRSIWDGSDTHAKAIAAVVRALDGFRASEE